jgi:hypothetical protein
MVTKLVMRIQALKNMPPVTETVPEVIQRIFASHQITRADQQVFLAALLSENSLSQEEQIQINQVLDALRKGVLKVVD